MQRQIGGLGTPPPYQYALPEIFQSIQAHPNLQIYREREEKYRNRILKYGVVKTD